jgi:hypothetical protein
MLISKDGEIIESNTDEIEEVLILRIWNEELHGTVPLLLNKIQQKGYSSHSYYMYMLILIQTFYILKNFI